MILILIYLNFNYLDSNVTNIQNNNQSISQPQ